MKILVKFPTRSRPKKFLSTIEGYMNLQVTKDVTYLITIDSDDITMCTPEMMRRMTAMGLQVRIGQSTSKIHAVNRDMSTAPPFDILVLASDDMICQVAGWDAILQQEMTENFPDTDGVLFHWDGNAATKIHNNGKGLNTMCILGRKYFNRFGYIYHPSFSSLWCDNEFTEVADKLGRQYRGDLVLFKHAHPQVTGEKPDDLLKKTESYYQKDMNVYNSRKAINFGL